MIKTLQNTLRQDKEQFTVPRSVQDTIPIRRIWPDGIFQFGSKFSKCIRFSDINYAIASKEDKTAMFLNYSELLNALDTGSTTKITIEITADDDMGSIAEKLQDAGLIRYKWFFRLFAAVTGASEEVGIGTYELNTDMDYHALIAGMRSSSGNLSAETVTVTIPEGYTVRQTIALLAEKGVNTEEALTEAAQTGDFDYDFIDNESEPSIWTRAPSRRKPWPRRRKSSWPRSRTIPRTPTSPRPSLRRWWTAASASSMRPTACCSRLSSRTATSRWNSTWRIRPKRPAAP